MAGSLSLLLLLLAAAHLPRSMGHCLFTRCSHETEPHYVCGTDGKTYNSECELKRRACIEAMKGTPIAKAYAGHCRQHGHYPSPCPPCPYEPYRPVCGSDGKTYDSRCELERLVCTSNTYVTVVKEGPCYGSGHGGSQGGGQVGIQLPGGLEISFTHCQRNCRHHHGPQVCGSDGNTYRNRCELEKASCKKHSLILHHEGPCNDYSGVGGGYQCNPYKQCPPSYGTRVCASNGLDYPSKCELDKVTCVDPRIYEVSCYGPPIHPGGPHIHPGPPVHPGVGSHIHPGPPVHPGGGSHVHPPPPIHPGGGPHIHPPPPIHPGGGPHIQPRPPVHPGGGSHIRPRPPIPPGGSHIHPGPHIHPGGSHTHPGGSHTHQGGSHPGSPQGSHVTGAPYEKPAEPHPSLPGGSYDKPQKPHITLPGSPGGSYETPSKPHITLPGGSISPYDKPAKPHVTLPGDHAGTPGDTHQGKPSRGGSSTQGSSSSQGSNYYECIDPRLCSESSSPVCGSDGVTYSNECQLKEASCRSPVPLTLAGPDTCEHQLRSTLGGEVEEVEEVEESRQVETSEVSLEDTST